MHATGHGPGRKGGFFTRLRERIVALSRSKHAHAALIGVSVVDGSVLPVPPFALLVPMVLAEPKKWFRYATSGTIASFIGGLIGYLLGHLAMLGIASAFQIDTEVPLRFAALGIDTTLRGALTDHFWMLALLCSILPTPFKVVAIGSGLVGVGLPEFMIASLIGRTVRMYGIGFACAFFGEHASRWFKVKV
ncbi:lipoprotein B [Vulgatibacter incomptus]|uniref:Lipoprotein B n=2 Tax=Vulgatibacter incomptus TaxID=1391653 RepID=A0A0K1P8J4_9BACT|nr:lipoprotein B [Vulgatibacter incomptus]